MVSGIIIHMLANKKNIISLKKLRICIIYGERAIKSPWLFWPDAFVSLSYDHFFTLPVSFVSIASWFWEFYWFLFLYYDNGDVSTAPYDTIDSVCNECVTLRACADLPNSWSCVLLFVRSLSSVSSRRFLYCYRSIQSFLFSSIGWRIFQFVFDVLSSTHKKFILHIAIKASFWK